MRDKLLSSMTQEWRDCYAAGMFTEFMEQRGPGHTCGGKNVFTKGYAEYKEEIQEAIRNLEAHNWTVDYIITHCGPNSVIDIYSKKFYGHDRLTDFLEEVCQKTQYKHWYLGHYHDRVDIGNHSLLYETFVDLK
jgi:hypothetical protein